MRNKLSSFRDRPIFIDANIFVYHAAGSKYTESVTAFLEKVENNEIEAFTASGCYEAV
jgi:predicted nucleic acid-binding protein